MQASLHMKANMQHTSLLSGLVLVVYIAALLCLHYQMFVSTTAVAAAHETYDKRCLKLAASGAKDCEG